MTVIDPQTTRVLADLDSRAQISHLVRSSYRGVAVDDVLGPVFAHAHVDWPTHMAKLVDFWAQQLLGEPGYDGNPLRAHAPIHARMPFTSEHYQRWLELFTFTVDEHFAGPNAELAKHHARRIAGALQRLLNGVDTRGSEPIMVALRTEMTTPMSFPPSSKGAER